MQDIDNDKRSDQGAQVVSPEAINFVRVHAVEKTQELARKLMHSAGPQEDREALVDAAYDEITTVLARLHPDREKEITFMSGVIKALHSLDPAEDNYTAEDIFCRDIAGVKARNQDIEADITFAHQLLTSIQRLGKIHLDADIRSIGKDSDVNEEFLIGDPEQIAQGLLDNKREFWLFS